ncbi:hypothetical protein [Streptomyces sp. PU-14G]|uniref:hypothetical protein n=1 Tax=Streptomyces sp. PU-14G TaxID=2800808 RepID=UPI0034DF3BC7
MGQFRGFDVARVRELAGYLDSVAGSMAPMHRQMTQVLQAAAGELTPRKVSTSAELQPLLSTLSMPGGVPLPLPTASPVTDFPVELFPSSMSAKALAAGPPPGSVDPFLRQTAADISTRCDRLEQVVKAAPASVSLDAGELLNGFADLRAIPPHNTDQAAVATWWAGLTQGQRAQYLYLKPEALEALTGLPEDVTRTAQQLAYFKVVPYKTSSHETTAGAKLTIAFFELGEGFGFRTEQMSDGTYRVTMIDNLRAGYKPDLGDGIDIGAAAKLELGDTWVFKDKAAADRLQQDINRAYLLRLQLKHGQGGMGGTYFALRELDEVLARIGQPKLEVVTASVESNAELGVGLTTPGIKFDGTYSKITSTIDPERPTVTESRDFKVEGTATHGKVVKAETGTVIGGTIQVVRDKNNPDPNTNITAVRLIRTVEGKLGFSAGADAGVVSGTYKDAGTSAHVVTLNVPVNSTPQEQAAARTWLKTPPTSMLTAPVVPSDPPPPDGDVFSRLAHDRGQVSAVSYKGSAQELKLGGTFKIEGIPIGLEASGADKEDHVVRQQYLGAPDPATGKRRFVPLP